MAQELNDAEVFGEQAPAPVAEAPAPTEFSDAEVFGEDDKTRLRLSVGEALKRDPERSAKVTKLREQTGLPEDTIERNFEAVDQHVRTVGFDKLHETSPALARKLADPAFANVAHDDTENLTAFEEVLRVTKNIGRAVAAAPSRAGAGLYGVARAAADVVGAEGAAKELGEQQKSAEAWADYLRGKQEGAGFVEKAALSGVESAAQTVLMLPAAVLTGSPAPLLYGMSAVTGGEAYGKAREKGIGVPESLSFATSQAVIEYATEKLPAIKLLEDLTGKTGFAKTLLTQLVTEIPGEQVATVLQDLNEWAVLNPEKPFADYLAERPSAAAQTLIATIVGTGAHTAGAKGVQAVADRMTAHAERGQQAEKTAEFFKQVHDLTANSKLYDRSPATFQQFVEEAAKDGPVQDVWVDATALAQILSQSGIDPVTLPASITEQMDEALAAKGDVRIPIGEYAATLAGTDAAASLLPHLRVSPEDLSQAEAKEFMQGSAEQFKAEAKKALDGQDFDTAWQESAKSVETELLTQLTTANRFTPDVNTAYASMMGSFYSVQAARLGITPEEMYVKYPLRIQAESPAGGATMEQGPAAGLSAGQINKRLDKLDALDSALTDEFIAAGRGHETSREIMQKTDPLAERYKVIAAERQDLRGEINLRYGPGAPSRLPKGFKPLRQAAAESPAGGATMEQVAAGARTQYIKDSPGGQYDQSGKPRSDYPQENTGRTVAGREPRAGWDRETRVRSLSGKPLPAARGAQLQLAPEHFDLAALGYATKHPTSGLGVWFTLDPSEATRYGPLVQQFNLDIRNPAVFKPGEIDLPLLDTVEQYYRFRESLRAKGHDGLMLDMRGVGGTVHFAAFDAAQVVGIEQGQPLFQGDANRGSIGTFDPNILKQLNAPGLEWMRPALEVVERIEKLAEEHGAVYVRWSAAEKFDTAEGATSRDYTSGAQHGGLSAVPIDSKMHPVDIAKAMSEYMFLRIKNPDIRPYVYIADRVGTDSDGYALVQNPRKILDIGGDVVSAIDNNFADAFSLQNEILDAEKRLSRTEDPIGRGIIEERLDENRKKLNKFRRPDSPAMQGQPLFQAGDANRGSISFAAGQPATIALLQKADLSTFLHEVGHFYLEVLADIAAQENAPAEVQADMQHLLDWFGVKDLAIWQGMTLDQKRASHEKLARGFEAYLFEGKAPSIQLAHLFARFRAWMTNVYRSLQGLNVELTDEVRGVMDRLLATQAQIHEAETARAYVPLFDTRPDGMTDAEWTAYQQAHENATEEAVETLQKRSLRDMQWLQNARGRALKALQKEADQKRAAVHREVTDEVRTDPVYAVQQFMRKGELPGAEGGKGVKVSLPALRDLYGDAPGALWRRFMVERPGLTIEVGGVHPDELAGGFGFKSGDEMMQKILAADPERAEIDGLTDQRMLERYGDINSPQSLERAASEAVHNDARARFIASEIQALNKATGQRKLLIKAAREFAAQIVARKKIRDVRPAQYEAAEARAARNTMKAYQKGKGGLIEAATEKRNQLVNHYATRAAYDALDTGEKGLRYLGKFESEGSRKGLDIDYLEQIYAILDRFDLRKGQSLKTIDARKSLVDWITEQEEQGLSPVIPDELRNEAFRKHYKDLTVEEFQGVLDAVRNIEHLGRLKKKLLTARDQKDFETAVDEIVASIQDNAKGTIAERRMSDRGILVDAAKLFNGFVAEHRKFASMVQQMDGFKDGGTAWEYLVRSMNERGDFEAVENEKATIALGKIFAPVLKHKMGQKVYFPDSGKSFTYEERLGIALHMGNEINRERVLTGEALSPQQLSSVLDTLTQEDWAFVQGVWDHLESYRSQIAEKERRLTGVEPQWVEPTPVQTKFGTLKGGYYPIKHDVLRSSKAEADTVAEVQRQVERGLYTRAQTRRGHLKARTESTGRAVRYDLGVVFEHVSQVIHDIAWHEYLVDANRLLGNKKIDAALREAQGPEKLRAMKDTLRDVAIGQTGAQTSFGKIASHVRFGATIAGLGWRVSTALLQPLGLTQSMSRIGVKWVAKGARHWLGDAVHLENSVRLVAEKSAFMRLRAKTLQREINEIRNKVSGKDSKIQASYFYFIQKMQLVADLPTWWGQYEKAMSEPGMTEDKAIALADQAVIDAQGSGQIKDLSGIERGQEGQKLFTVFYSFFNTTFNLTARAVGRTNFKSPGSVALLAADMALLYAIPATLGLLLKIALKSDWDDPEEDLEKFLKELPAELVGYLLGTMVGLRELSAGVRALSGHYSSYTGPASVRLFSEFQKLSQQIEQGEADAGFWKALNNVGGLAFHYPAGQINQTVEGVAALLNGETDNPLAVISGPPK